MQQHSEEGKKGPEGYYLDELWDLGGIVSLCSVMGSQSVLLCSQGLFVKPCSYVCLHSTNLHFQFWQLFLFVDLTCDLEVHYKRILCK